MRRGGAPGRARSGARLRARPAAAWPPRGAADTSDDEAYRTAWQAWETTPGDPGAVAALCLLARRLGRPLPRPLDVVWQCDGLFHALNTALEGGWQVSEPEPGARPWRASGRLLERGPPWTDLDGLRTAIARLHAWEVDFGARLPSRCLAVTAVEEVAAGELRCAPLSPREGSAGPARFALARRRLELLLASFPGARCFRAAADYEDVAAGEGATELVWLPQAGVSCLIVVQRGP